jgi:tetratricopeptide (TPR) repeat protein
MKSLLLAALLLPAFSWADDFDDFGDEPGVESGQSTDRKSEVTVSPGRVDSAMEKQLSEARKSKSEAAIVKAASQILAVDPKHLEALNTLAVFYYESKRFGLAKILLRRALKDHGDEPALHNNMGIILLSENEPRLALESFRKSVQLKGSYRIGATNLAAIYLEHGDYKRSLSPLEESYKATKSDLGRGVDYAVDIANNYAVALMGTGDNSKAEDVFEAIADSDTRNPKPYLNFAILLTDVLKKKKDALRIISKLKFMTEDREILKQVQELEKRID